MNVEPHAPTELPASKGLPNANNCGAGWVPGPVLTQRERTNLLPLPGIKSPFSGCTGHSLVTMLTELSPLLSSIQLWDHSWMVKWEVHGCEQSRPKCGTTITHSWKTLDKTTKGLNQRVYAPVEIRTKNIRITRHNR